jgi:hypothetical protein
MSWNMACIHRKQLHEDVPQTTKPELRRLSVPRCVPRFASSLQTFNEPLMARRYFLQLFPVLYDISYMSSDAAEAPRLCVDWSGVHAHEGYTCTFVLRVQLLSCNVYDRKAHYQATKTDADQMGMHRYGESKHDSFLHLVITLLTSERRSCSSSRADVHINGYHKDD